jgi:hypothetical protein
LALVVLALQLMVFKVAVVVILFLVQLLQTAVGVAAQYP